MTEVELDLPSSDQELRQQIANLTLVSHVPGRSYEGKTAPDTAESKGGKRPPGGDFDRPHHPGAHASPEDVAAFREDFTAWLHSYHRRTPDYFRGERAKLEARWRQAGSDEARMLVALAFAALATECANVVEAWCKAPIGQGVPAKPDTFEWKCNIADDERELVKIMDAFGVSKATVYRYRAQYRGLLRREKK